MYYLNLNCLLVLGFLVAMDGHMFDIQPVRSEYCILNPKLV